MRPPGKLVTMILLWVFAVLLAGSVIWLMILRGPAVMP